MEQLIAPTINFIIVVVLLTYFARNPLKKLVRERRGEIKSLVDEAASQKKQAEEKYTEFARKLESFEGEAKAVLEHARHDGEEMKAKIIREAHSAAERIIREAEATAQANAQDYRDKLMHETIAQAIALTEKLVAQRLSGDEQRRLIADYVKGVQKS